MTTRSAIRAYVDSQLAASQDQLAALQRLRPSQDVAGNARLAVLDALREALARYVLPYWRLLRLGALPLLTALGIWVLGVVAPAVSLLTVGSVPLPVVIRLAITAWVAFLLGIRVLRLRRRPLVRQLISLPQSGRPFSLVWARPWRGRLFVQLLALVALLLPLMSLAPGAVGHLPTWVYWTLDAVPLFAAGLIAFNEAFIRGLAPLAAPASEIISPLPAGGLSELQERVARLKQMQEWLVDNKLRALVDDAIGQQVKRSERRQTVYAVIAAVASLIVGWLLSAIAPASVLAGLLGQKAH